MSSFYISVNFILFCGSGMYSNYMSLSWVDDVTNCCGYSQLISTRTREEKLEKLSLLSSSLYFFSCSHFHNLRHTYSHFSVVFGGVLSSNFNLHGTFFLFRFLWMRYLTPHDTFDLNDLSCSVLCFTSVPLANLVFI